MKKTIFIASVFVIALIVSAIILFRNIYGFENAVQAVDNIKVGWNLGNTLESNGEWIGLYTDGKPENYETWSRL